MTITLIVWALWMGGMYRQSPPVPQAVQDCATITLDHLQNPTTQQIKDVSELCSYLK